MSSSTVSSANVSKADDKSDCPSQPDCTVNSSTSISLTPTDVKAKDTTEPVEIVTGDGTVENSSNNKTKNNDNKSSSDDSVINSNDNSDDVPPVKKLKGLLKKPGSDKKSRADRSGRRVTFSETMMVFCDDWPMEYMPQIMAMKSPSDFNLVEVAASGYMFEPPIEYQDCLPFDPPPDYRDVIAQVTRANDDIQCKYVTHSETMVNTANITTTANATLKSANPASATSTIVIPASDDVSNGFAFIDSGNFFFDTHMHMKFILCSLRKRREERCKRGSQKVSSLHELATAREQEEETQKTLECNVTLSLLAPWPMSMYQAQLTCTSRSISLDAAQLFFSLSNSPLSSSRPRKSHLLNEEKGRREIE